MTGSRGDSAGIAGIGIAAVAAWLWFPYRGLIIAGAVIAALGAWSLAGDLRRGRAWHQQDVMLRKLWTAAKRVPSGYVLTDPDTGELLSIERERGWLTLAVTDPPGPGRSEAIVTRYMLGKWAAPMPPPLFRHLAGLADLPPAGWRWRQHAQLAAYNAETGALKVTTDELAELLAQVRRAAVPAETLQD
jgi:hypothetical protein